MRRFLTELLAPLEATHKRSVVILILLSFANMLLLMTGVGMLLPLIAIMLEEDVYDKYPLIRPLGDLLGSPERSTLVLVMSVVFMIFMFGRAAVSLWILAKQKTLNANIKAAVSGSMFNHFLEKPYSFYRRENSAKILRALTSDVRSYVACLDAGIVIVGEIMVGAALIALMAYADPQGLAVIAVSVVVFSAAYFQILHPRIRAWGKQARKENALLVKHTNQAVGGIKEIKVSQKERAFHRVFVNSIERLTEAQRKFSIAQGVPSVALEVLATMGIVALLVGIVLQGKTLEAVLPVLAVFAVSTLRLMSLLGRLTSAVQAIRFNYPGMASLHETLRESSVSEGEGSIKPFAKQLGWWRALQIENMSFDYGSARGFSLKKINLTIRKGEAFGVFGVSGSGKSTLADLILGLHEDFKGTIAIDNHDLRSVCAWWQKQIGYVPQSVYILDDSLRANIALGVKPDEVDDDRIEEVIEQAQLTQFVSSLDCGIFTSIGERGMQLSGGEQQRVGIARALYRDPSILIFDEATSALDSRTESEFMDTVALMRGSVTMLVIAHRLSTLRVCDELIEMREGEIVAQGSYEELVHAT